MTKVWIHINLSKVQSPQVNASVTVMLLEDKRCQNGLGHEFKENKIRKM